MRNLSQIAERTIKPPANKKVLLHNNGKTQDIIKVILKTAPVSLKDTREFIQYIRSNNVYDTCRRVWHFLKANIKYQIDPSGDQYIQTPAYTWKRKRGDCKSYSIFVSSLLKNLGITHKFRFVSYKQYDKTITHVYIVVPNKGKNVIMDVVMPEFNTEKPYQFKKDYTMAKIYQLSGTGIGTKPRNQGKIIVNLGNKPIDKLTEGELDLLIARDRLLTEKRIVENVRGIGSVKAEKYQDSLDMINDALEAINDYEVGKISDIEEEIGMIAEDAVNGVYSNAREICGIGSIFGRKSKRKAKRKARKAKRKERRAGKKAIRKTYKGKEKREKMKEYKSAHGTKTGKFLRKVAKTVKKGGKAILKVTTMPARLAAKAILEIRLPKAAPHFLYLFIKDEDVAKMPQAVQDKRKKQARTANFIVNGIGMKRKHFMGIVKNGILKRYGKSPEAVIRDQMKGKVSGIWGAIEDIAEQLGIEGIFGRKKRRARRATRKTRRKTKRTVKKAQRKARKGTKGKARRVLKKSQRKVRKQIRKGKPVVSARGTGQKAAYQSLLSIRDNINKSLKGKSIKISQDDAPDPDDWTALIVKKEAAKKRVDTKAKKVDKTKDIINRIPDAGPYFLYLFIKDKEMIAKLPAKVRAKRKQQEIVAEYMVQSLGISRNQFMALCRKGIKSDFKQEPEALLADQMKGEISGIGMAPVIPGALKALMWIVVKIKKLFGKLKGKAKDIDTSKLEFDAPDPNDWDDLTDDEKDDLTDDLEDQFDDDEFDKGGSIWDTLKF